MSGTKEHSFPRRFAYKVTANLVLLVSNFVQAALVSRALGPAAYGSYHFLTNTFIQVVGFFEMRSSTWLYTTISSGRNTPRVLRFYGWIVAAVTGLTIAGPLVVHAFGLTNVFWPSQSITLVVGAALVALFIWYADIGAKVCDALGLTVSLERVRIVNAIVFLALLGFLASSGRLKLESYLSFQVIAIGGLLVALATLLRRHRLSGVPLLSVQVAPASPESYGAQVFAYTHPMLVYTLAGLVAVYADRWLLQKFGGSVEQGLFSLALGLGMALNAVINALHPLVMREFAISFATHNIASAAQLFRRLIPPSYTLSAFGLCFAAMHADFCVTLVGGASFKNAAAIFAVLAVLPILHNYSLLSGSVLFAANKTALLRNIGLVTSSLGICCTVLLVAPRTMGGMELGALGLAIKTVALEFLGNNIVLWFNARLLGLRFGRYLGHQVAIVLLLFGFAYGARQIVAGLAGPDVLRFVAAGLVYSAVCALLFWRVPALAGISRSDAKELWRFLRSRLVAPSSASRS